MAESLDLSDEQVPTVALQDATPTFDPKEPARRRIAFLLLAILSLIVVVALVVLFLPDTVGLQRAKDLIGLVFTPIVGLVGSVVGFYFGAQTVQQAKQGG